MADDDVVQQLQVRHHTSLETPGPCFLSLPSLVCCKLSTDCGSQYIALSRRLSAGVIAAHVPFCGLLVLTPVVLALVVKPQTTYYIAFPLSVFIVPVTQALELPTDDDMLEMRSRLRHALLTGMIQDPDAYLNTVQPAFQVCLTLHHAGGI